MDNLSFSIIICTYNGGEKISKVIDSILEQDEFEKYIKEIIVVNNNSTDNTEDIIDRNLRKNKKILKVNQEKQGLSYARLKGIEECTSEWIIFIDDDNILSPNWVSYASEYIKENSKIGAFNGAVIPLINEMLTKEEEIVLKNVLQGLACTHIDSSQVDKNQKKHPYRIPFGAGLVIKSEPLKELADNGWLTNRGRTSDNLISCEDTEMCLFVKSKGYKFGYNPKMEIKHLISRNRLKNEYLNKLWCGFADGNFNLLIKSDYGKVKVYLYLLILFTRLLKDKLKIVFNEEYKVKAKLNYIYRNQFIKNVKS